MGRYRTDLSFKLAAPDEVRVYRDGQHIGDISRAGSTTSFGSPRTGAAGSA